MYVQSYVFVLTISVCTYTIAIVSTMARTLVSTRVRSEMYVQTRVRTRVRNLLIIIIDM
jgi:hypothetical protein